MKRTPASEHLEKTIAIDAGEVLLEGDLKIPENAGSLVIFLHGSRSSRFSPRNRQVAKNLNDSGMGTLLFDLLTDREAAADALTARLRFEIEMLAERVVSVTRWLIGLNETQGMSIGYFGASTGAAAALVASAKIPESVGAIVSRGGRPDLAGSHLTNVKTPTLLIVGDLDTPVIELNRSAFARIQGRKELTVVPGAGHSFEEPGKSERVSELAREWFIDYL